MRAMAAALAWVALQGVAAAQAPAVTLTLRLKCDNLPQLVERYGADFDEAGLFVRTREPLSVGARLAINLRYLDGAPILDGEGTIAWVREQPRGEEPAGYGLRFDKLSEAARQRLAQIVAERKRRGLPSRYADGLRH
jgi:uncharacterized protein (TIGR02266 family)